MLQQPLAPWWKRLVAIIIDGMVVGFSFAIIALVIAAIAGTSETQTQTPSTTGGQAAAGVLFIYLVAALFGAIYYGAMNGSQRGQTVGKMALGIAVRDARTGGSIGFWRAFGRNLITWVFTVAFVIPYIVDSLSPLWDKRRQALHDKAAHSVVVDLRP